MLKIKPFVKWAGGKSQLLESLMKNITFPYDTYYEPFVGGGALLFAMQPKKAVISDINKQLINAYRQLKNDADAVIREIDAIEKNPCDKDYYLKIRDAYNAKIARNELDAECAGLMIWINKHCFNGLYRVNSKGLFNVPYNNNVKANSMDRRNLIAIGRYLASNDVDIRLSDFEETCSSATENDFVYFDSPYIPESETANFTDYTKDGFAYEDHVRLSNLYRKLDSYGVKILLSNNDVPLSRKLYSGFTVRSLAVHRNINSAGSKRHGREILVKNYT